MYKNHLVALLILFISITQAQVIPTYPEYEAQAIGGKQQIEQVFETQFSLPKAVLTSNFNEDITVFFDLDSTGSAINIKFTKGLNNMVRNELKRMFLFLKFNRTQSELTKPYQYWLIFKCSTEKYSKYFKQKSKNALKKAVADSSYAVYSRADKSPEFYKNGEEGMNEFILSQIEYPKLAIEKTIEGTVVLDFIVETNGYVTTINVKKGVNGGCTEEAIRLLKLSKWQPATLNNKLVRYSTFYPITFSLRNVNKDGTSTIGQ